MSASPPSSRWRGDVAAGAVLLGLCATGFWLTTGFREVPAMLSQNVPPTFFPRLVLGALALLGLALVAGGLRRAAAAQPAIKPLVPVTALVIVLTPVAIAWLGTWLTISAVCVALPWIWGERRAPRIAALALAMPAFVYAVFALALDVRFPVGRLLEPLL